METHFVIHMVDEKTIQNGILSAGWHLKKYIIMSYSSFKSHAENAPICIK